MFSNNLCICVLFIDILAIYQLNFVNSCISTGVCTGSACCGGGLCAQPPPPVRCVQSSCQPGYSCGQYGCARNRARSALTQNDGTIVPIDNFLSTSQLLSTRNIYGIERRRSQKPIPIDFAEKTKRFDYKMFAKLTNPNYLFRQCCEDRRLPDSCLSKCHFNSYTKESLQEMFFKNDPCPIEAAADMQYCAAQGRDHTSCCIQNGIHTTLAGKKCLTFCDQRANHVTKLDYSFLPCYDLFENMKRCFFYETKVRMETKFQLRHQEKRN